MSKTSSGTFITIEGIEGSGKSTLASALKDRAEKVVSEIVLTREPGATAIGKTIRKILLESAAGQVDPTTELMLFAADRAQHVTEVLRPTLERGGLVICDRYIHSTVAYQGYGRNLDRQTIDTLNVTATGGLLPDLVLLIDLDPQIGLARAKKRVTENTNEAKESWNRFEAAELQFHQSVRQGFLELAKIERERFVVLDGTMPPDNIADTAWKFLKQRLEQRQ